MSVNINFYTFSPRSFFPHLFSISSSFLPIIFSSLSSCPSFFTLSFFLSFFLFPSLSLQNVIYLSCPLSFLLCFLLFFQSHFFLLLPSLPFLFFSKCSPFYSLFLISSKILFLSFRSFFSCSLPSFVPVFFSSFLSSCYLPFLLYLDLYPSPCSFFLFLLVTSILFPCYAPLFTFLFYFSLCVMLFALSSFLFFFSLHLFLFSSHSLLLLVLFHYSFPCFFSSFLFLPLFSWSIPFLCSPCSFPLFPLLFLIFIFLSSLFLGISSSSLSSCSLLFL